MQKVTEKSLKNRKKNTSEIISKNRPVNYLCTQNVIIYIEQDQSNSSLKGTMDMLHFKATISRAVSIVLAIILRQLNDNAGELKLPRGQQTYEIAGVEYTVSSVFEDANAEITNTLHERFKHLVNSMDIDLKNQPDHGKIPSEYVPAADQKGE